MRVLTLAIAAAVLTACGGGRAANLAPAAEPAAVVDQFMRAVADSNMTAMASLWGTSQGSAAETGRPQNYPQRIAVIHAYLKGTRASVLTDVQRTGDHAILQVQFSRGNCRKQIPWTMVRTGSGRWLVEAIDIGQMGAPGRLCSGDAGSPGGQEPSARAGRFIR